MFMFTFMFMLLHGSMECTEAWNVKRCLNDLTQVWRGTLSRAFHVHFTITLFPIISWREKPWLYFHLKKAVWIIWALNSCFSLTHLCRTVVVSGSACFRMCKHPPNSTSDWLAVLHVTLSQPIVTMPVSCLLLHARNQARTVRRDRESSNDVIPITDKYER